MTDADKIKWFDKTIKWFEQWEDPETAIDVANNSSDAVYDLFFDMVEQWRKVKESK